MDVDLKCSMLLIFRKMLTEVSLNMFFSNQIYTEKLISTYAA